jgi:hypothetical protein
MILLLLCPVLLYGQKRDFSFVRKLSTVTEAAWYSVSLPDDIFSRVNASYSDLRIYKITGSDTVEIPYLIRTNEDETQSKKIDLKPFNKSTLNGKLYISFEVPDGQVVNYADLDFEEENFDATVLLEGSDDRNSWFNITSGQRIVSLKSDLVDFKSTTITFPDTHYKFLRVTVEGSKLTLREASFLKNTTRQGKYLPVEHHFSVREDKAAKQTLVDITLKKYQPIERIAIDVDNHQGDYYRYYSLEALSDSAQTPKGWNYFYTPLSSGYLTSLKPNEIQVSLTSAKTLRLTIYNADNPPLKVDAISLQRPEIELRSKLSAGDDYYLFYGNRNMRAPLYDLVHFQDRIPDSLASIDPGDEVSIGKTAVTASPFIENKNWLWVVMGAVILLLGFFTLKMMKNKA